VRAKPYLATAKDPISLLPHSSPALPDLVGANPANPAAPTNPLSSRAASLIIARYTAATHQLPRYGAAVADFDAPFM
jgi:hypothetical protein